MRRLDPHRTPQELQPARVPTVLIFSIGTLAWLAILVVLGARHLLGYGTDAHLASIAAAGVVLGLIGMVWGRWHNSRQARRAGHRERGGGPAPTAASPSTTTDQDPT